MAYAQQVPPGSLSARAEAKVDDGDASKLTDLIAQATLKYSVKDYDAAAELYSQATELQAEINGEMSPENADLLYAYGRCLYHVAVKNSDVLGSKVGGAKQEGTKKPQDKNSKREQAISESDRQGRRMAEEVVTKVVEENDGGKLEEELKKGRKPYFQFTGDENWDTSEEVDDEDDPYEEESEGADEEDDFVNAYEVLDLARVLLLKKLGDFGNATGKAKGELPDIRQLKERLADTYDLQAEISLEGERFPTAVVDLKSALELKVELFPQESSLLAEAHYKLSLALEFSSVTQQKDKNGEVEAGKEAHVDEAMREESAQELKAAIASCKLRIQKEEAFLLDGGQADVDAKKPKVTRDNIEDAKEMVEEMEQRLIELRQVPMSIDDPRRLGTIDGSDPLTGILGSILGQSPEGQQARLEEALEGAQDLSNLVRRKRPAESERSKPTDRLCNPSSGKRKTDFAEKADEVGTGKKARISGGHDD